MKTNQNVLPLMMNFIQVEQSPKSGKEAPVVYDFIRQITPLNMGSCGTMSLKNTKLGFDSKKCRDDK